MICAYCGKEAKGTKEHIISSGVLGLFPECYATIDSERKIMHLSDPMIKDVCAECNNHGLSYIDSYAKSIVEQYFTREYEKDESLDFEYNYALLQKMLLKYAFNDLRSRKGDVHFFDENVIGFLLNESNNRPLKNISILAGLAINTSPMPAFIFGNNKLRWSSDPILLPNSLITHIDYDTGILDFKKDIKGQQFEDCSLSFVFRFNSLQIILLCWETNISEEQLQTNNAILNYQYPYSLLDESDNCVLSRCTSEVTYHLEKLIDVSWGQSMFDDISYMRGTFSAKSQSFLKEIEREWKSEEQRLADEHPR